MFFDFLNTRKKIILYVYDREDYLSSRGIYRDLSSFPFPIVECMDDVIREINLPKNYDDEALIKEFCPYDDADAKFDGEAGDKLKVKDNGKENIFIDAGRLANNGITASLKNLLNTIDRDKKNYYLLFSNKAVRRNLDNLKELSELVNYYC